MSLVLILVSVLTPSQPEASEQVSAAITVQFCLESDVLAPPENDVKTTELQKLKVFSFQSTCIEEEEEEEVDYFRSSAFG